MSKKRLKKLFRMIPVFTCKEKCADCCGPVVFSDAELRALSQQQRDKLNNHDYLKEMKCPFVDPFTKKCQIYEHRPLVCRLFGTVQKMKCPHNCGPSKLLSFNKENRIMTEYIEIMNRSNK